MTKLDPRSKTPDCFRGKEEPRKAMNAISPTSWQVSAREGQVLMVVGRIIALSSRRRCALGESAFDLSPPATLAGDSPVLCHRTATSPGSDWHPSGTDYPRSRMDPKSGSLRRLWVRTIMPSVSPASQSLIRRALPAMVDSESICFPTRGGRMLMARSPRST